MRTVPCAVPCERYWAGKQSGLCQDLTPAVPAQRKRPGKGARERGAGSGRGEAAPAGPTPSGLTAGTERRGRMSRRPDRQREAGPGSAALQRGAAAHRGAMQGLGEGGACLRADAPAASKSRGAAAPAPATRPGRGCGVSPAGLRPGGLAQGQARLGGWAQPGARPPSVSPLGAEGTSARCAVTQDLPRAASCPAQGGFGPSLPKGCEAGVLRRAEGVNA